MPDGAKNEATIRIADIASLGPGWITNFEEIDDEGAK